MGCQLRKANVMVSAFTASREHGSLTFRRFLRYAAET
jgi:hypothetical protein